MKTLGILLSRTTLCHLALGAALVLALGCGGKHSATEKTILDWGQAINLHLTTPDSNYEVPDRLEDVDPVFRNMFSTTDAWGNELYYRKIRDDRYHLISAGPDGVLGNDDDIVSNNGLLSKPADVYAEHPIER